MLRRRVEEHVAADIVDFLPGLGDRVGVESTQRALLHQAQAPWRGEPEDADALVAICWCHDNCYSLVKHGLIPAVGVYVNGGEEAGLGWVGVDPTKWIQLVFELHSHGWWWVGMRLGVEGWVIGDE